MTGKDTGRLIAKSGIGAAIIAAGAIAVVLGCSADTRSRLMHFFFEYPQPASAPEHADQPTDDTPDDRPLDRPQTVAVASRHAPFIQRQCQSCHAAEFGQATRDDFLSACRDCHPTYFEYRRFAHAPVASADCRYCHVMHVSQQAALIKAPQRILCTDCHDAQADDSALDTYHRGIDLRHCTDCHDAHFGESSALLKKNWRPDQAGEP